MCTHTNEDTHTPTHTHLSTLAVVFVLAGECRLIEPLHNLSDPLGGVGQHGPQGYTWRQGTATEDPGLTVTTQTQAAAQRRRILQISNQEASARELMHFS